MFYIIIKFGNFLLYRGLQRLNLLHNLMIIHPWLNTSKPNNNKTALDNTAPVHFLRFTWVLL